MKKVLILVGLAGAAFLLFGHKADDANTVASKFGYNPDGTIRPLTDAEAKEFLSKNPAVVDWYNDSNNKQYQDVKDNINEWLKNQFWLGFLSNHISDYNF